MQHGMALNFQPSLISFLGELLFSSSVDRFFNTALDLGTTLFISDCIAFAIMSFSLIDPLSSP